MWPQLIIIGGCDSEFLVGFFLTYQHMVLGYIFGELYAGFSRSGIRPRPLQLRASSESSRVWHFELRVRLEGLGVRALFRIQG